jgi:hypothetical protein
MNVTNKTEQTYLHPQVMEQTTTLLGPLERSNFDHWMKTDRVSEMLCSLDFRMTDKIQKPSNSGYSSCNDPVHISLKKNEFKRNLHKMNVKNKTEQTYLCPRTFCMLTCLSVMSEITFRSTVYFPLNHLKHKTYLNNI